MPFSINFISPDPALLVARGASVTVIVQVVGDAGEVVKNQSITWQTFSEENAFSQAVTTTNDKGESSNVIWVQKPSPANLLTVSVFLTDHPEVGHYVAQYKNLMIYQQLMTEGSAARPNNATTQAGALTYCTLTSILTDENNAPVKNYPVAWTAYPNPPSIVLDQNWNLLVPTTERDGQMDYIVRSDTAGRVKLYFKNSVPAAFNLLVGDSVIGNTEIPIVISTEYQGAPIDVEPRYAAPTILKKDVDLSEPGSTVSVVLPKAIWSSPLIARIRLRYSSMRF